MATEMPVYTREQAIADLLSVNAQAKRCMYVVGTDAYPTPWDRRHADLDALLDTVLTDSPAPETTSA